MSSIKDNLEIYKILHKHKIVSDEILLRVEEAAKQGVVSSCGIDMWDQKELSKHLIMTIWVASGYHNSWCDGGFNWIILKLDGKFMLTGGFHRILPCELKDFTTKFCSHISSQLEKYFMHAKVTIAPKKSGAEQKGDGESKFAFGEQGEDTDDIVKELQKLDVSDTQSDADFIVKELQKLEESVKDKRTTCAGPKRRSVPVFKVTV